MYLEPWPGGEPASNSQMLGCGVIIHDDVHRQVLRYVLLNLPEKAQILLMPVARSTFREYFAVGRVQGRQTVWWFRDADNQRVINEPPV